MTIRRRNFLKGIAGTIAMASVAAKKKITKPAPELTFNKNLISILLGPSFDGQAEFSIVHSQDKNLRYVIFQDDQQLEKVTCTTLKTSHSDFEIDKFLLRNLPVETDLTLKVFSGDRQVDERIFSSIESTRANYTIGIVSCMKAAQQDKAIWQSLESQKSDFLMFLGDSVYIDDQEDDLPTPQTMWKKFVETRMVLEFYQWKRLVPVLAVWDDHDFGGNNSNMSFQYVKEAQENFKNFFAQNLSESSFVQAGPGISFKFQIGNQLFLMLDGRSFRERPNTGNIHAFFGEAQEEWIFDSIKDFKGLIWMNNGSQWFNHKGLAESFRKDYKVNFNRFVERLNQADKKVLFTSGDVHYSEVCETPTLIKNKSLEITSSCMHSSIFVGLPFIARSEGRIASTWKENYVICKTAELNERVAVEIRCFTKDSQRLFGTKTEIDLT